MKNEIALRLSELDKDVNWLLEQIVTANPLSLKNYILGKNPAYPITLKEAVQIAEALQTDIFALFPEIPRPSNYIENHYPDLSAEVDKRLAGIGELEYQILNDEDILQEGDEFMTPTPPKTFHKLLDETAFGFTVKERLAQFSPILATYRRPISKSATLEASQDTKTDKA